MEVRASEIRQRLNEISQGWKVTRLTDEIRTESDGLQTEYRDVPRRSLRAAIVAESEEAEKVVPVEDADAETRERREMRSKASKSTGTSGRAWSMRDVDGVEAEYAAAEGAAGRFPLKLLAPDIEVRQTTDAESGMSQGSWLDRLFAQAAASRVGITMRSVPSGVASFPVTTHRGLVEHSKIAVRQRPSVPGPSPRPR